MTSLERPKGLVPSVEVLLCKIHIIKTYIRTYLIRVYFTSKRNEAVPSCIKCCASNKTHVVEASYLFHASLRVLKHIKMPSYCIWHVPGGELEVSVDTNMLKVADSTIQ